MAAAESGPLAQSGGLGDVLRALPPALVASDRQVRRFLPAYGCIDRSGFEAEEISLAVSVGPSRMPVRLLTRRESDGVVTTLVENEECFGRDGLYGSPAGGFRDNARRFILFSRAVCEYAARAEHPPDVLHAHDWHTGLLPMFVRHARASRRSPRTVLTIHNMGYQGRFGREETDWLSLRDDALSLVFRPEGIEDHGGINFLKAGLVYADRVTAVSPTYAREITTPEGGAGLDAVLRRRPDGVAGILNGADYEIWNPATDRHLPRPYGPDRLEDKEASRSALRKEIGLPPGSRPILGVVSRFVQQKGIDLVAQAAPALLEAGADLALLGTGEAAIVEEVERLHRERPDRVGLRVGFDEKCSHLIVAGSDLLLVPSRYEPCGLTQMHALRYGTIPVVRRTGGLADTVRDEREGSGTGFLFERISSEDLVAAACRALRLRASQPDAWRLLQRRAMAEDFSWSKAAASYLELYAALA
jgi:starch synthase